MEEKKKKKIHQENRSKNKSLFDAVEKGDQSSSFSSLVSQVVQFCFGLDSRMVSRCYFWEF